MKKPVLTVLFITLLPALSYAEMKMQNTDPSPDPVPEHVMRNTNPSPDVKPEHVMQNTNPKKWVSSNAAAIDEGDSGKNKAKSEQK